MGMTLNRLKKIWDNGEYALNGWLSINYSFNVIDERPETIRQTLTYHREIERISSIIVEVLKSNAEIIDNRSLYY